MALHDEGILMLTGTWDLGYQRIPLIAGDGGTEEPSWVFFGAGAQDGVTVSSTGQAYTSASFGLNFKGVDWSRIVCGHSVEGSVLSHALPLPAPIPSVLIGQRRVNSSTPKTRNELPGAFCVEKANRHVSTHGSWTLVPSAHVS